MSIATKTGDSGSTALMYGRRVSKTDLRVAANGAVDELNAVLGLARAALNQPAPGAQTFSLTQPAVFQPLSNEPNNLPLVASIFAIQKELVILMGELAVVEEDRDRYIQSGFTFVDATMVDRLTAFIDDLEQNHRISYEGWATPGATPASAALDLARTVCRRAERHVVALGESGLSLNPEIIRYLNRLSDLCWLWARWVETRAAAL